LGPDHLKHPSEVRLARIRTHFSVEKWLDVIVESVVGNSRMRANYLMACQPPFRRGEEAAGGQTAYGLLGDRPQRHRHATPDKRVSESAPDPLQVEEFLSG